VIVSLYRKLASTGVLAVGLILPLGASAASAQVCAPTDDYCTEVDNSDSEVLPGNVEVPTGAPAQAEVPGPAPAAAQAPSGGLPLTGGDVVGMTVIGAGAIAVGTVLVRRSKRASTVVA
jgi:LPXTG-motif cell wall-anchored protein